MTAPLPRPPAPWDEGFTLFDGDQLAAFDAEMEAFGDRIRSGRYPSRAERLRRAVVAVFTETGRHLRRMFPGAPG